MRALCGLCVGMGGSVLAIGAPLSLLEVDGMELEVPASSSVPGSFWCPVPFLKLSGEPTSSHLISVQKGTHLSGNSKCFRSSRPGTRR